MGEIRRIYEQHYWRTWLKIQRERQTLLEQRAIKLDIEQTFFKAKQKQCELEERYNHYHDPKTGRFVSNNSLTGSSNSDRIKVSGAVSGALDRYSPEAQEHADRYYEEVRHMKNDTEKIASNTGFTVEEIKQVKDFIFNEKHDLGGAEIERFYPNYEMAQSWQRLIEGKNIQQHDITLIRHELTEQEYIEQGMNQSEAHRAAEQIYDYSGEVKKYYAETDKHKKK